MTSGGVGPIQASPPESIRFGLRIGRWTPESPDDVSALGSSQLDAYDVVIVRQPSSWADRWVDLMRFDEHVALHADTLVYWSWRDAGERLPSISGAVRHHLDAAGISELVRDVFGRYQNHYASNPLLDRDAALEGYVEWAVRTADESGGYVTVDDDEGPLGFGLVDWSAQPPDVRLAGLCVRARGGGRYRDLVLAMMASARARGHAEICISTQAQNIAVQRTWAALGWRPSRAYETTHLVRSRLLTARLAPASDR